MERREDIRGKSRLKAFLRGTPSYASLFQILTKVGFHVTHGEQRQRELLFGSTREMFFSPFVQWTGVGGWRRVIGDGAGSKAVFRDVKTAFDLYFEGRPIP